jgi:hypothetical protein
MLALLAWARKEMATMSVTQTNLRTISVTARR